MPDPRLTLARDGIAARSLAGIVPATRYVDTTLRQAKVPSTSLRRAPSPSAEQLDQLLFGELFEVLDEADSWAFGQAKRDGYVGYVDAAALGVPAAAPTVSSSTHDSSRPRPDQNAIARLLVSGLR